MNKTMNTGNGVVTAGSKKGWLTQEEIEVVKKQFFPPNAKPEEMNYCFEVAKQFNLNPITKQIYFVPRKSQDDNGMWHEKIEPLVGRDGFLAIAHRSGKFGGIESTSTLKEVPKLIDGEWKMTTDLVAIAKVWRTDSQMPFVVEVFYSEYVQRKKSGEPTRFWAEKPHTMLKKVAESQALRKAFNISGLYSPEEVGVGISDTGDVIIDTETVEAQVDVEAENQKLIQQEIDALAQLGLNCEYKDGFVKVVGSTYGKTNQLRSLGYSYHTNKKIWIKKLSA
ncbi:phage recombination protein Bet [Nitrosophilus labii]|uniref:phage recombination protein Bet n=1 Tax=Nitrosophilus labii TaxID=2706014 RepID=UPI001657586A|nr:phage recombination protein Bet [Nitrosophilus labii]